MPGLVLGLAGGVALIAGGIIVIGSLGGAAAVVRCRSAWGSAPRPAP